MKINYFIVSNSWFDVHIGKEPISIQHGAANGYVSIPKSHPLYSKDYDDVDRLLGDKTKFYAHGGLTFGKHLSNCGPDIQAAYLNSYKNNKLTDDVFVYGFDTFHCDDTKEEWTLENVLNEARDLGKAMMAFGEE